MSKTLEEISQEREECEEKIQQLLLELVNNNDLQHLEVEVEVDYQETHSGKILFRIDPKIYISV